MSKQVNSFILPDNIIKSMEDKIKETKKTKIEHGFSLCRNKGSNVVIKGPECTGTECTIKIERCSEKNQIDIGDYHTHHRSPPTMSALDMATGCTTDIECIGSVRHNKIRCFTRKTDRHQCLDETIPFTFEEDKLKRESEKIRKTLKSPGDIIKKGMYKFLKDISQYEREIEKYHIKRSKLLNDNFNRIDIK